MCVIIFGLVIDGLACSMLKHHSRDRSIYIIYVLSMYTFHICYSSSFVYLPKPRIIVNSALVSIELQLYYCF